MPNNKRYNISLPDGRTTVWDEERYNRQHQDLLNKYPQAQVAELSDYDENEGPLEGSMYHIQTPDGRTTVWDAAKMNESYAALREKYPDAVVTKANDAAMNYWQQKAGEQAQAIADFDTTNADWMKRHEAQEKMFQDAAGRQTGYSNPEYFENVPHYEELSKQRGELQAAFSNNPYIQYSRNARAMQADGKYNSFMERRHALEDQYFGIGSRILSEDPVAAGIPADMKREYDILGKAADLEKKISKTYSVDAEGEKRSGDNAFSAYMRNFARGHADVFSDPDFWSRGLTQIDRDMTVRDIIKGLEAKGLNVRTMTEKDFDDNLTDAETALLTSFARYAEAQALRANDMAPGYTAGKTAAESLGFMAEFLATGAVAKSVGSGLKASESGLAKWLGRELAGGSGEAIANSVKRSLLSSTNLGKGAVSTAAKTVQAAYETVLRPVESGIFHTVLQPSTYSAMAESLSKLDDNGELMEAGRQIWSTALDQFVENWSESMGGGVEKTLALPFKAAGKVGEKVLSRFGWDDWARWVVDSAPFTVMREAGFNGLIGEMGEEWLGNAVRLGMGLMDKDEFKKFASAEQQLEMAASFAPMSLFGLGSTSIAAARQAKDYSNTVQAMRGVLNRAGGMSEEEISGIFDRKQSKKDIADALAPVINKIVHNAESISPQTREYAQAMEDYATTLRFAQHTAMSEVLATAQSIEKNRARDDMRREISTQLGAASEEDSKGTFAYEDHGRGEKGYQYGVMKVTTVSTDRGDFYYLGREGSQVQLKNAQTGDIVYMSSSDYLDNVGSGTFRETTSTEHEFLDRMIEARRAQAEQARNDEKIAGAMQQIAQRAMENPMIHLGTAEAPKDGVIVSVGPDGVVVNFDQPVTLDGRTQSTHVISLEQAGNALRIDAATKTDEQIAQNQADLERLGESARALFNRTFSGRQFTVGGQAHTFDKVFQAPKRDERGNWILTVTTTGGEEVMVSSDELIRQTEEEDAGRRKSRMERDLAREAAASSTPKDFRGNDLPMKTDAQGNQTVDQNALWDRDAEAWCIWNDARRGGDTSNSKERLTAHIAALSRQREELAAQKAATIDLDEADALESQILAMDEKMGQYQSLLDAYDSEAAAINRDAAFNQKMADSLYRYANAQSDEQAAAVLEERKRIIEDYIAQMNGGRDAVTVCAASELQDVMAADGCTLEERMQVAQAMNYGVVIDGFYNATSGRIYFVADNIVDADRILELFVHERQHKLTGQMGFAERLLEEGISRQELSDAVMTLSGNAFYAQKSDTELADEVISYSVEQIYRNPGVDVATVLARAGVSNAKIVNFIKNLIDGNTETQNNLSDTGKHVPVSAGVAGGARLDAAAEAAEPAAVGEEGSGTAQYSEAVDEGQQEVEQQEAPLEQNEAPLEQQPQTALEQVPVDAQTGEPAFEQAPVDVTFRALTEMLDGNEDEAEDTARQMLDLAQKALAKVSSSKAKAGASAAEIIRGKKEHAQKVAQAQASVDYWRQVADYRQALIREAQERERQIKRQRLAEARRVQQENGRYVEENAAIGTPVSLRDHILRMIATGKVRFIWSNDKYSAMRGLGAHLGFDSTSQEKNRRIWMLSNADGLYPEEAAESMMQTYAEALNVSAEELGIGPQDVLDEMLDVIRNFDSHKAMIQEAQALHQEQDQYAREIAPEEAAAQEQQEIEDLPADDADFPSDVEDLPDWMTSEGDEFSRNNMFHITPEVREEMDVIVAAAKADGTYLKAPNGADTELDEEQWALVRTQEFKRWFGDWEKAATAKMIIELEPESLIPMPSDKTPSEVFKSLSEGRNKNDGTEVKFFYSAYKKVVKLGGISQKIIATLPNIFNSSILAYVESDNRGGQTRPDGTLHRTHPNTKEVRNYIGKVRVDGKDYYVRITVNMQKNNDGVHSYFATDVDLYNTNSVNGLSQTDLLGARVTANGIVDAKLEEFFRSANDSSKVIDKNGEPKVMYHGTAWDPYEEETGKAEFKAGWFTGVKRRAEGYGEPVAVFINIKSPAYSSEKEGEFAPIPQTFDLNDTSTFGENDGYISFIDYPETPELSEFGRRRIKMLNPENYEEVIAQRLKEMPKGRQFFSVIPRDYSNQIKSATENNGKFDVNNVDIRFHTVTDEGILNMLNSGPVMKMYCSMTVLNPEETDPAKIQLVPVKSAKVRGQMREASRLGQWEQADEDPSLASNGKFNLKDAENDSVNGVNYNPYFHLSDSMMNDQFTGAYRKPNTVVVEVEVPESELTSGYHAEGAANTVGMLPWHSGTVNAQLPKEQQRNVMLSRWRKPVRIVPNSEVAQFIADKLQGTDIAMPWNLVTPQVLTELDRLGVKVSGESAGLGRKMQRSSDGLKESLENVLDSDGKIVDLQQFDNLIDVYRNGGVQDNRYNKEAQRELREGSRGLVGGYLLCRRYAEGKSREVYSEIQEERLNQESAVESWAKSSGVWIDNTHKFLSDKFERTNAGGESVVYTDYDNRDVVKSNELSYYNTLQEMIDRIVIHNTIFPETAMNIIGYGRSPWGSFSVVYTQPLVVGMPTPRKEIEKFMSELGMQAVKGVLDAYEGNGIYISDLHSNNVLTDERGDIYVIDGVIKIDNEQRRNRERISNNESGDSGNRFHTIPMSEETRNEMQVVEAMARLDGSFMKAPNGADTNLSQEQWALVRTKAFKNWFGDWENDSANASKIVDENGEPMVVYHGTMGQFNTFDREESDSTNEFGKGMYFSSAKALADRYASVDRNPDVDNDWRVLERFEQLGREQGLDLGYEDTLKNEYVSLYNKAYDQVAGEGRVIGAFLNIRNPYVQTGEEKPSDDIIESLHESYDGVIDTAFARRHPDLGGTQYVAFTPGQIKSATENNGEFSRENPDIRFHTANYNEAIFISNAMQAVGALDMNRATGANWIKAIQGKGGLKAGEDKWIGLSDWLRSQDGQVSREAVLDFIRRNQIQIEEVNYSENARMSDRQFEELYDELPPSVERFHDTIQNEFEDLKDDGMSFDEAYDEMIDRYGEAFAEAYPKDEQSEDDYLQWSYADPLMQLAGYRTSSEYDAADDAEPINPDRLPYTTKGLDNKREIALTIPSIDPYNAGDKTHFGDAGGGRAVAWIRFGETVDTGGNSVLVIDEIQSKRHQNGRERGYRQQGLSQLSLGEGYHVTVHPGNLAITEDKYQYHTEEYGKHYSVGKGTVSSREEAADYLARLVNADVSQYNDELHKLEIRKVPAAPFEKNWHELAMKRMLRFAAEEGFAKVAWTTGKQQSKRYDLGGTVSRMGVFDSNEQDRQFGEVKAIQIDLQNGDDSFFINVDNEGNVVSADAAYPGLAGHKLSEVVGSELADKIMTAENNTWLEASDLEVGGEGMKGFYDEILPRFMNKYGKKWGVSVKDVTLPELEEAGRVMHSVDVTPAMKQSVMEGQTMFHTANGSLVGIHNISEEKLLKAMRMGALVNPSAAVINIDKSDHDSYGTISLIMPSALVDKKTGRNAGTFDRDAWTPVYPNVEYFHNKQSRANLNRILDVVEDGELRSLISNHFIHFLDGNFYNSGLEYVFLKNKGIEFDDVYRKREVNITHDKFVEEFLGGREWSYQLFDSLSDEERFNLALAIAAQGYKNGIEYMKDVMGYEGEDATRKRDAIRLRMIVERYGHFADVNSFIYKLIRNDREAGKLDAGATIEYAVALVKDKGLEKEFSDWQDDVIDNLGMDRKFFVRYREDGTAIYRKATPENISKYMKSKGRNASDDHIANTEGKILARLSRKFTSLAQIRRNADLLTVPEEGSDPLRDLHRRLHEAAQLFMEDLSGGDWFMKEQSALGYLEDYIVYGRSIDFLKADHMKYTGRELELDDEDIDMLKQLREDVKAIPTPYFETKFERPVYLEEFAAAVVPDNASEKVKSALRSAGLPVFEYESRNSGSRRDATLQAVEADGIRFHTVTDGIAHSGTLPQRVTNTLAERTYRKSGGFDFTGKNRVESVGDVAYIFRELENYAVENSFMVFVKDGVPTILHTGSGTINEVSLDYGAVIAGYMDFGPDIIYMVHNHPSGNIHASGQDIRTLSKIQDIAMGIPVQGIIIDTVSGQYGVFNADSESPEGEMMTESDAGGYPLEVQTFDRIVFAPDAKRELSNSHPVRGAEDVAAYLSAHRLGDGSKVAALLLNHQSLVLGNVVLNYSELSAENAEELARQLSDAAVHANAKSVILYGDFDYSDTAMAQFNRTLRDRSGEYLSLLDMVRISGRHTLSIAAGTMPARATLRDGVRFHTANRNQEIFVSNAQMAVEALSMNKATGANWIKAIQGKGGLKAGEDRWLGLSSWLSEQEGQVSRDDVLKFIADNRIRIEEDNYGELDLRNLQAEFDEIYDDIINGVQEEPTGEELDDMSWEELRDNHILFNPGEKAWEELRTRHYGGDDFDLAFYLDDSMKVQVNDSEVAGIFLGAAPINSTRLDYTTEGLDNKREIALTVPTIEPYNRNDEVHFGDAGGGRAVAWVRFGETIADMSEDASDRQTQFSENRQKKLDAMVEALSAKEKEREDGVRNLLAKYGTYTDASEIPADEFEAFNALEKEYWDMKNEYSSLYQSKEEVKSPARVLFIDEIQSKRHQDAREIGYRQEDGEVSLGDLKRRMDEAYQEWKYLHNSLCLKYPVEKVVNGEMSPEDNASYDAVKKAREEASGQYEDARKRRDAVPPAPFEKNWHELAMKRMLRLAAEEGFDKIAWTNGRQQSERYGLGQVISTFDVTDREGSGKSIDFFMINGAVDSMEVRQDGRIEYANGSLAQFEDGHLADVVGKEWAERLLSVNGHESINAKNEMIGGEGMKGFYDDILPRFMNKYGKKWGVSVEDIDLPSVMLEGVHSIDVTPEMKESVLEGQTMFHTRESREADVALDEIRYEWSRGVVPHSALVRKRVPVLQKYLDAICDEDAPATVVTFLTVMGRAKEMGLGENDLRNLKKAEEHGDNTGITGYKAENGTIFIFADNCPIAEPARSAYVHEYYHGRFSQEQKHTVVDILGEQGLREAVHEMFNGFYDAVREPLDLAEEFLCRSMEFMYSARGEWDYRNSFAEVGVSDDKIINFVKTLYDEGQQNARIIKARRWVSDYKDESGRFGSHGADQSGRSGEMGTEGNRSLGGDAASPRFAEARIGRLSDEKRALEEVGKNGFAAYLGAEAAADMFNEIISALPEDIRGEVVDRAMSKGFDFSAAVQSRLAELAFQDEISSGERTVLNAARDAMRRALGLDRLSAARALMTMVEAEYPGEGLLDMTHRLEAAERLGFLTAQQQESDNVESLQRFHLASSIPLDNAADWYNKFAGSFRGRMQEVYVDQFASVNALVEAVEKATGSKAEAFEDIRYALNQMSSKALARGAEYNEKFFNRMLDSIQELMKAKDCSVAEVERYVMLKHGLERNEKFAKRDAIEYYRTSYGQKVEEARNNKELTDEEALALIERLESERDAKIAAVENSYAPAVALFDLQDENDRHVRELERIRNDGTLSAPEKDAERENEENRHRRQVREIAKIHGLDENYMMNRLKDYSGLTGLYTEYDENLRREDFQTQEQYNQARLKSARLQHPDLASMENAAQKEIDDFENGAEALVESLWKNVNRATKQTLIMQRSSGLITAEQYISIRSMFDYYVPLRGFEEQTGEDLYSYYTDRAVTGNFVPAVLAARGRKSRAESPFGYIGAMANSAVVEGVKNEAKNTLYYFASNRAGNGILEIRDVWYEKKEKDPVSGRWVYEPVYYRFNENLGAAQAEADYKAWEDMMREKAKHGQAYRGKKKLDLNNSVIRVLNETPEHTVALKVNGEEKVLYVNGNPRAAQAIKGEFNLDASATYQKFFGGMLRLMSALNTSYNPEFWVSNMQRDLLFALMNANTQGNAGKMSSNYLRHANPLQVLRMMRAYENGTLGNGRYETYYREFAQEGAVTGYAVVKGNDEWDKATAEYMKWSDPKGARKAAKHALEGLKKIGAYGEAIEQATRFAAYVTARESGKTVVEAVSAAKEISVNFNRKGSGKAISLEEAKKLHDRYGRPLSKAQQYAAVALSSIAPLGRSTIMFFNAAIQGLNAMYKAVRQDKTKATIWMSGYMLAGALQAVIHNLIDDDDDYLDIPDHERRTNALIGANGFYFKWALPQESRMFYAFGDMIVNHALGRTPDKKLMLEMAEAGLDVMPVEVSKGLWGFFPSVAQPFIENWRNENFYGGKIYNDLRYLSDDEKARTPRHQAAYSSTSPVLVKMSKGINRLFGGTEYDNTGFKLIDWLNDPAKVEHVIEGLTGGLGTTVGRFLAAGSAIYGGQEIQWSQMPFVKRFVTMNDERSRNAHTTELFYYYKGEAEHTMTLLRKYQKDGMRDERDRLKRSGDYEIARIYERYARKLKPWDDRLRMETDQRERRRIMREQDIIRKQMLRDISDIQ